MSELIVYGDRISGNCLKVKWVVEYLGISYEWRDIDITKSETRTPEFLALNPSGQVPIVVLPDGRALAESNAIILYLAAGSDLIPADGFACARMLQWLFWEQYSHEPYIAVRRFHMKYLGRNPDDLDPKLLARGHAALARMEDVLDLLPFMAGDSLSLADVALVAYTRMAEEGGFDLSAYPSVRRWIGQVEDKLGIAG